MKVRSSALPSPGPGVGSRPLRLLQRAAAASPSRSSPFLPELPFLSCELPTQISFGVECSSPPQLKPSQTGRRSHH